jgi:polysaccharide deacetylase family protein (PEP-CTERM system associated)
MLNAMSIDVEDWFHVYNMSGVIPQSSWDSCESRVENNTRRLLDLFAKHRVKATFFTLGWVAERFPGLVREIDSAGHEVASHSYAHRLITHMTQEEFERDLARSLDILRPLSTSPVVGFRAPSFSVTRATLWATDTMARLGLTYDSSVFPIGFHPDYGIGDAPLSAYAHPSGIAELPMSVANVMGRRIPCSGGGYFRLLPYAATRALIRRCNAEARPVVFYLHPWEIDPGQPRVKLPASKAFRHYNNLDRTLGRLDRLLGDFEFGTVREVLARELPTTG